MKLALSSIPWASRVLSPLVALMVVLCIFHGVNCADPNSKNKDTLPTAAAAPTPAKKLNGNGHNSRSNLPKECPEKDEKCETDRQGLEAIRSLHLLIDDDHNGNVDQHESDEFLRDELQYTDGFERQALFHNNDKLISVEDLWRAWKYSTVHNWTVEDVQEWLAQDVDLPQYAPSFASNNIDGSVLPRLVNSTSTLMLALGIRNMHKQRLALKAMDAVLFGAPKRVHSFTKDLLLVSSLILAVGGCWFACLHHRYSQTQVKKMMKDLESLQKAEDALRKLSNELADAEKNQSSLSQEKQEELRMLRPEERSRQSSVRLKVPLVTGGDKSPNSLSREGSVMRRQEGEKKLKEAEEELSALREALSEAETRLELQQQLETQWSVPGELQAWLQLTHELEMQHHSLKKQAAERQRLAARDGCDKIKKRNKAFFGSLRIAHSNSLDDIEQSIMDARAALEEVRQDLQESQQRWQIMEILCGFPIIVNPGLTALRQALGRDATGNVSRGTGSLLTPGSIDETEEDMQPADSSGEASSIYNQIPERQRQQIVAWARRSRLNNWMKKKTSLSNGFTTSTLPSSGKSSTFLKQQTMAGSTSSLPHASTVGGGAGPGVAAGVATLPRRDSRDTDIMLSRTTEGVMGTAMGVSTNATTFHLGPMDNPIYQAHERSHSNASITMISPMLSNGHHHPNQQPLRTAYTQALNHPPFHLTPNGSTQHILAMGSSGCLTPAGINPNTMLPHRAATGMMFTSASGNHLSSLKQVSPPSAVSASHGNRNGVGSVNGHGGYKHQTSEGSAATGRQESLDSNGNTVGYSTDCSMTGAETPPIRPYTQSTPTDNTDRMSLDSMIRGGHTMTPRNRLDRTPEVDINSSLDTDSVYSNGQEAGTDVLNISLQERSSNEQTSSPSPGENPIEKKPSKRKKFLPNFLQKGKGKQKTS